MRHLISALPRWQRREQGCRINHTVTIALSMGERWLVKPRGKQAQLRLITFPSGIIPVFQPEMMWRLFERQTWRENVITFPCTWISRQCPFKTKKALEGYKGGGRERNEGWRRIIHAEACDISPKWLPLGAAGTNVISSDSRKEERWALQEIAWPSLSLTNHSPLPKSWLSREEVRPRQQLRPLVAADTLYLSLQP